MNMADVEKEYPLPWHLDSRGNDLEIVSANNRVVLWQYASEEWKAKASWIVKTMNASHKDADALTK